MKEFLNKCSEDKYGKSLTEVLPCISEQQTTEKLRTIRETNKANAKVANEDDNIQLLSTNESYRAYERRRKLEDCEKKGNAQRRVKRRLEKEKRGELKPRRHVGPFTSYIFEKDDFLNYIKSIEEGKL